MNSLLIGVCTHTFHLNRDPCIFVQLSNQPIMWWQWNNEMHTNHADRALIHQTSEWKKKVRPLTLTMAWLSSPDEY